MRIRILIFFSDTGGGHRAAAQAIGEALHAQFPMRYEVQLVDGFKECAFFPFNHIPATYYPVTTYIPWFYGWVFHLSNRRSLAPFAARLAELALRRGCDRVIRAHDPALALSVHPIINRAPCRALKRHNPRAPFVTVVTDLFDAHSLWFSADSDLVIVPTSGAYERGRYWNFPPERMRVIGQPIGLNFSRAVHDALLHQKHLSQGEASRRHASPRWCDGASTSASPRELRARSGLEPDRFTILLVGGGEGMGPLDAIARALANAALPIQLIVIAGRNERLRRRLLRESWPIPVHIQGFVHNMADWMRASDLVITKAGPGTIMEAVAMGKPIILSGNLPGQEEGNVTYVEQLGLGVLRSTPQAIVEQVRAWLQTDGAELRAMQERAQREARPEAALEIARVLDEIVTRATHL